MLGKMQSKQTRVKSITGYPFTLLPRCQIGESKEGSKIKPYSVVMVRAAWKMERMQLSQGRDMCSSL